MPGFTQIPNEVFDDSLFTSEKMTKGQFHSFLYRIAQFQPGGVQKRGIIIELEPGQIGWSQVELARISKRSLNWVRSTLHYLEKAGQIVMEKTNVSSTITLLKWVSNGTAERIADGLQKVQQKDSRRDTNNIVNTENTVNIENTPKVGVDFENSIEKLWRAWIGDSKSVPTNAEKKIITNALKYNPDADDFWLPLLTKRKRILKGGGNSPSNMKYWFDGGFREMELEKAIKSRAWVQEGSLEEERDW